MKLRKLAAAVMAGVCMLCALPAAQALEQCGSVQGARILETGRYQMTILIDRFMELNNYTFYDYQRGGVPNECLSRTALGTRICFDVEVDEGEETIINCRNNY